jgi:hypothetical protein
MINTNLDKHDKKLIGHIILTVIYIEILKEKSNRSTKTIYLLIIYSINFTNVFGSAKTNMIFRMSFPTVLKIIRKRSIKF